MKKMVISALLGALLATGSIHLKLKLDDRALNSVKLDYAGTEMAPVCLAQRDGGEAYVILDSDAEAKVYRGVRVLLFLQMPFEVSARSLNERVDLKKVDCQTGL